MKNFGDRYTVSALESAIEPNSIIVSGINPVYIEHYLSRRDSIWIIPVSRRIPYATNLVTPKRPPVEEVIPRGPRDFFNQDLVNFGSYPPITVVATENINLIKRRVSAGTPVFLEAENITSAEFKVFEDHFRMLEVVPKIYRLFDKE